MRALLVIAAIVLLLILVGWITIAADRDRPGIHLETEAIREDAREAKEAGERAVERVRTAVEERTQRDPPVDQPADRTPNDAPPALQTEDTAAPRDLR